MCANKVATKAVFFTTDRGYLIPSLVAALQVQRQLTEKDDIHVLLILMGFDNTEADRLSKAFEPTKLRFQIAPSIELTSTTYFYSSHVTKAALARLCAADIISETYTELIYMDGDVQIVDDIRPLLLATVPLGKILAGVDQGMLALGEPGSSASKWYENYTSALGLQNPLEYFNSGIFALQRSTLLEMGPAALRYFQENSVTCVLHDQSALNAVFAGRREYLSPRYNFMPKFHLVGGEQIVSPAIIHFADRDKPWHDSVIQWMEPYSSAYTNVLRDYPVLGEFASSLRRQPSGSPYAPRGLKAVSLKLLAPARRWRRHRQLRAYMAETRFAVA